MLAITADGCIVCKLGLRHAYDLSRLLQADA